MDEDAWSTAPSVVFDTSTHGDATGIKTTVRALWGTAGKALYFAIDSEGAGFYVDESRPVQTERTNLYEEDCAEIFLGTDPARRTHYYEMEVGPLGHFFDLEIDRAATNPNLRSQPGWSGKLEIGSRADRAQHVAHVEIAIRAPEILAALTANATLPLGLFRTEGKAPRHYLAWSPAPHGQAQFPHPRRVRHVAPRAVTLLVSFRRRPCCRCCTR